jgi:hypothetical protein
MTQISDTPLAAPPRKVHLRRNTRNIRRAYRLIFALIILISGGWAALDLIYWNELTADQRLLTAGFGVAAVLSFLILRFVEHPYQREMRLARSGYVAPGQVTAHDLARGRRGRVVVCYTFRTVAGDAIEGRCVLPRRVARTSLEVGQAIDVLYDPASPQHNKPRLALEHVEFA